MECVLLIAEAEDRRGGLDDPQLMQHVQETDDAEEIDRNSIPTAPKPSLDVFLFFTKHR
jgi:hypothetical protein